MNGLRTRTFHEASAEIEANRLKHAGKFRKTEYDDDEEEDVVGEDVIERIFAAYDLEDKFEVNPVTSCVICISSVKRQHQIWNCENCFSGFHLSCIQRWANDSIFQQKQEAERLDRAPDLSNRGRADVKAVTFEWGCPKCRHAYKVVPKHYECFCGKRREPQFDPWLIPHSCGDVCGRPLRRNCGHTCLILCHPGACPPCPKTVTAPCHCGNSAPAMRRCFDKTWSCGKPCNKLLNCGQHRCAEPCHAGACQPCAKTSVQPCRCLRRTEKRPCASPQWQCEEKCGLGLSCGHHKCDLVCHAGNCPPCPLSLTRKCPCGKSTYKLACTVATPTCGETCGKMLECGVHACTERCHRGACSSCLQMTVKMCKCGSKRKEVACAKDFMCESKCKTIRDCGKHACNRKCCDGRNCPSCEQICGKTLSCKNHKCGSRCHRGTCFPCNETKVVTCKCGASRILVPCGLERLTKPPKCKRSCVEPPECHHDRREPHTCHFGPCPNCKMICDAPLKCGHRCKAKCHDLVKKTVAPANKVSGPWDVSAPTVETLKDPCPDCEEPIAVTCLGGHETWNSPCYLTSKTISCGRPCGRRLPCGNHTCARECHKVKQQADAISAGTNCRKCEVGCEKERPEGCVHKCPRGACHPGDCGECPQMIRIWCMCRILQLYVSCGAWTAADSESRKSLACCQSQCPKTLSCGHRCSKICHDAECSDVTDCKKKVKVTCECKRRKAEALCPKRRTLPCDDVCQKAKAKIEEELKERDRRRLEEETNRELQELERFEATKLSGKRKRQRQRRRFGEDQDEDNGTRRKRFIVGGILFAFIGFVSAFYFEALRTP